MTDNFYSGYKSYIDIYSPGKFPKDVTPEQFIEKQLRTIRRNPVITTSLYYLKDMESFATGLRRIDKECRQAGVKFEFMNEPYGFVVRFHRHCGTAWGQDAIQRDNQNANGTLNGTLSHSEKIKEMIRKNPEGHKKTNGRGIGDK